VQPELRAIGNERMEVKMNSLPDNPNLNHLKKQAKELLRLYQAQDPAAFARFRAVLPVAAGKDDGALSAMNLRLHDAQSCLAREYGFPSWAELKLYVELRAAQSEDHAKAVARWLHVVCGHKGEQPRPALALRWMQEQPELYQVSGDVLLACLMGDDVALKAAIAADPNLVNQIIERGNCECGSPLGMPPLFAVTYSSFVRLPEFRAGLQRCARLLLDAGADPNLLWNVDGQYPLQPLHGAAGYNRDPEMTRLLLAAGAKPDDNESLYHSMESKDLTCTRLLLEAGAKESGNAFHHLLDYENPEGVRLLLAYGANPNQRLNGTEDGDSLLLWAIRRRRSAEIVKTLLDAGADPFTKTKDGVSAYRMAQQFGLTEIAGLLQQAGAAESLSEEEQFVAACARADKTEAERLLSARPDIFSALSHPQLHQLPNLAAAGVNEAVKVMVELGWPIATPGGDWNASALNHAVFRGDAELTRFLLNHGASWTERHGFDDNVAGTLSWASRNKPVENGDWVGCAEVLLAHGMIPYEDQYYSEEVIAFLAAWRATP
jgi:ankyrin repeat protein